jgi:hypothetical protein
MFVNVIQVGGKLLFVMQQSQLASTLASKIHHWYRLEYCLAGRIPQSSGKQNSFGRGDRRVGMVLISPKQDAL